MEVAKRALVLEVNVILEWGFWSKAERVYYRREAESLGARTQLHYLNIELDELWKRLSNRNSNLPSDIFIVTKENLELWAKSFEPPNDNEMFE